MRRFGRIFALVAVGLMVMLTTVDMAEARRSGGSFGSRGSRTFAAPPVTRTAPNTATPIERTMTPGVNNNTARPGMQQAPAAGQRRGFFGGLGGGLLGGLMMGGLFGMLLGSGFGGGFGFLGMLLQIALILGAITLAMRMFARRQQTAYSGAGPDNRSPASGFGTGTGSGMPSFSIPRMGSNQTAASPVATRDIEVAQDDLEHFEGMLKAVQKAYGAEDYASLRRLTTPEAMSYLAEELSENATRGVKNDVREVHLIQGDVAEAWSENGSDYATVAMRYESIDVMRDRSTGQVVSGDPDHLSETVEIWTFVRKSGGEWLVSAIQSTDERR